MDRGQNPPTDLYDEIHSLVPELLYGRLSRRGIERLEALLLRSREAREVYLDFLADSEAIRIVSSATLDGSVFDPFEVRARGHAGEAAALPNQTTATQGCQPSGVGLPSRRKRWLGNLAEHRRGTALALVATLVAAVCTATLWRPAAVDETVAVVDSASEAAESDKIVATLTGMVDCTWADAGSAPSYGGAVLSGQEIHLVSGLAQLTFESGAKVVLEGPARFTPEEMLYGTLALGRATAVVSEEATGFRIETPSAEIIDLGTSFGVEVSPVGDSEVHVLEGEVLTRAYSEEGRTEFVHLYEDMAVRMATDDLAVTSIELARDRFIDDVRPRLVPDELPDLPVSRDLALWLAADGLVELDSDGGVIAWNDIRAGDNESDEIAWQPEPEHRPVWVENAIGGKPAIRFARDYDHLVTTPLATTSNQTVFIVFRQSRQWLRSDREGGRQLLSYNGPPVRYLEDLSDPGVLQIDDSVAPGRFIGKVFMVIKASKYGMDQSATGCSVGEVLANEPLPLNQPTVLTYVYSHRDNYSSLYMGGVIQGTSRAQFDIAINSRKVIGKHGKPEFLSFNGDISEVVIFNDRLTEGEIDTVNRHLTRKYRL